VEWLRTEEEHGILREDIFGLVDLEHAEGETLPFALGNFRPISVIPLDSVPYAKAMRSTLALPRLHPIEERTEVHFYDWGIPPRRWLSFLQWPINCDSGCLLRTGSVRPSMSDLGLFYASAGRFRRLTNSVKSPSLPFSDILGRMQLDISDPPLWF